MDWTTKPPYDENNVAIKGGTISGVGGDTMASDAAARDTTIKGSNAYAPATANTTGGDVILSGGIGQRLITVVDYSLIDAGVDTITVTINGVANVGTEGAQDATHWKAETSNTVTATNIATWADGLSGVSAASVGAVVYITPDSATYSVTLATSMAAGEGTVTSGTDGGVLLNGSAIIVGTAAFGEAAYLNVGTAALELVQLATAGVLPALDGSNLTNVPAGTANDFGVVTVGAVSFSATTPEDTLTFASGVNVTLTPNSATKTLTIAVGASALGNAAYRTVGTAAGGLLEFVTAGVLPAADGGNLTNMTAAAGLTFAPSATLGSAAYLNPGTASGNLVLLDANKLIGTQLLPFNPGTASGNVVVLGADKLISTGVLPIGTASGNLVQLGADKLISTAVLPVGTASGNLVQLNASGHFPTSTLPFNPGTSANELVQRDASAHFPDAVFGEHEISRANFKDVGDVILDLGNVNSAAVMTADYSLGGFVRFTATGDWTLTFNNWPTSMGTMVIEMTDAGKFTAGFPTSANAISWLTTAAGGVTTAFTAAGITLQTAGINTITVWGTAITTLKGAGK